MMSTKPFQVLLYYKYVQIPDAAAYATTHLAYCKELGVKGRILVASEGINGTLSGTKEQTAAYMDYMHADPLFADMPFKVDEAEHHAFRKLFVRHREELVTFRLEDDIDPSQLTGKYLDPKAFYEAAQRDDVVIVDARTDYEYDLGHFHNAIRPDVSAFRDFPTWVEENLRQYKDKPILTYCTGGIRCEKFSGYLLREGFQDVSQLAGGIVSYGKDPEVQGRLFDGKCYVFDDRIGVAINHTDEATVVSHCKHCGEPCDRYVNCVDDLCHRQHFACLSCAQRMHDYCTEACKPSSDSDAG